MKKDFWLERWQREEIGFHQSEVNVHLIKFWPKLNIASGATVFVPLCGKSQDMQWLHEMGQKVIGVELSAIAVHAFFNDNGYSPQYVIDGKFDRYEANGICILHGDFFDLSRDQMTKVSVVYDRASLIALPPQMREGYVSHLVKILPPATRILLITVEYPQQEMEGPPFSVSPDEVAGLYRNNAEVHLLAQLDVLAQNARFQQRGLSRMEENVFLLELHQ